jgi:hypothetical protein
MIWDYHPRKTSKTLGRKRPKFAWRDCGKPRKPQPGHPVLHPRLEPGTSKKEVGRTVLLRDAKAIMNTRGWRPNGKVLFTELHKNLTKQNRELSVGLINFMVQNLLY